LPFPRGNNLPPLAPADTDLLVQESALRRKIFLRAPKRRARPDRAAAGAGGYAADISRKVRMRVRFVAKWIKRFLAERIGGLSGEPDRGRKPFFPPDVAVHLVELACERPVCVGDH